MWARWAAGGGRRRWSPTKAHLESALAWGGGVGVGAGDGVDDGGSASGSGTRDGRGDILLTEKKPDYICMFFRVY